MNQTIRKRIEDIKNGVVPEGYKKTKAGIVPIEWEESRLSKYLVLNNEKNKECKYLREDVFSISGEQGVVNQIKHMGRSYAGESLDNYGVVYPMDIVYTKSPLKDNPYGIIKTNLTGTTGIVSVLYAVYKPKANVVPKYVQYYFENDIVLNNYLLPIVEIGPKHTMNIGDKQSLQGVVAFATKKEQEKITEILSEHDKLIKLKEKLIEQKKQQKKYLMQQLLTGKKRLPGFTGEWGKYKFNDLFNTIPAKNFQIQKNDYLEVGQYPVVDQGKVKIIGFSNNKEKLLKVPFGGVIVFGDHTREVKYINFDFVVGADGTQILFEKDQNISFTKYLYYVLSNKHIQNDGYSRHFKYVKEFNYKIPNIKEQQAIIDILSQADKEIELLQKDLEEEKVKKKALMQLLLTGIVRLC